MSKIITTDHAIASLMAVAAMAEDCFHVEEAAFISDVATALEMPGLQTLVAKELLRVKDLEGEALAIYLRDASSQVVAGEEPYAFEAALQVVLADGCLSYVEASNLLIIADALHLEHTYVLLMLADAMRGNADIDILFE